MRLVVLPLDGRPCTHDFPLQLGRAAGMEVRIPDTSMLGCHGTPSDFGEVRAWLTGACEGADVLVCSLEQLAYGGLVSSRSMGVMLDEALGRVGLLRELKRAHPGLEVYVSSVIMRTTVSALRSEDLVWWRKVAEYSRRALEDTPEARHAAELLREEIPAEVLGTFLAARERNHRVNREAVALVADGVAQEACLLQEDSSTEGPHRAEQRRLLEYADALGVRERVGLHCGADEHAAALVGRLAAERASDGGGPMRLYVEWLAGDEGFVALCEDRPFAENLSRYLGTCRIRQVGDVEDAQAVLAVYAPEDGQADLCMEPDRAVCAYSSERLEAISQRLGELLDTGLAVGLLDVYFGNGGEGRLLRLLARQGTLPRLAAYAGWNTASNSAGTILGQLLCVHATGGNARLDRFTRERLLDDWVYQAIVRPGWNRELIGAGVDVWNLPDARGAALELQRRMEEAPESRMVCPAPFSASLAWPRTFEVRVVVQEESR